MRAGGTLTRQVLIVDDDAGMRQMIREDLEARGFDVEEASTAHDALRWLDANETDAVLLDLGLPDLSGMELLNKVTGCADAPVVVITGRGGELDRCLGLESGADDYMVKPFSMRELSARVVRIIDRTRRDPDARLHHGDLVIDLDARDVRVAGDEVGLTSKEFDLLALLAGSPRRVFDHEQILHRVWSSSSDWQSTATIAEHVYRLRHKLDPSDGRRWIQTCRGIGYRFNPGHT